MTETPLPNVPDAAVINEALLFINERRSARIKMGIHSLKTRVRSET